MGYENRNATADEGENGERFIDKAEVGRRLGIAPRTVDAWMARGLIPFVKCGRAVRFRWSRVRSHLESHFEVRARSKC